MKPQEKEKRKAWGNRTKRKEEWEYLPDDLRKGFSVKLWKSSSSLVLNRDKEREKGKDAQTEEDKQYESEDYFKEGQAVNKKRTRSFDDTKGKEKNKIDFGGRLDALNLREEKAVSNNEESDVGKEAMRVERMKKRQEMIKQRSEEMKKAFEAKYKMIREGNYIMVPITKALQATTEPEKSPEEVWFPSSDAYSTRISIHLILLSFIYIYAFGS